MRTARPSDVVELDSADGEQLVAELRGTVATVLIGSAVSSFQPTGLPTGMDLGRAIAQRLAAGGASDRERLVDILAATAFEHVMERCPDHGRVREVLSARLGDVRPNAVHRAFARLAATGTVGHVITPNYDVAFERAFADTAPPGGLALVRAEDEAGNARGHTRHVLFKIHGCATEELAGTMAFRLTDEAQLPAWKRGTLRALVAGRPLLVVAYSGMDFEICPELPRLGASRLVWLHYGGLEGMTANARRVVRAAGGVVVRGSAQDMAAMLLGEKAAEVKRAPAAAAGDFADALFSRFSEDEVDAWRTRLFGEIGCARDAIVAAERLLAAAEARRDTAALGRALSHQARGRFHQGRYLDAAAGFRRAARIFRRLGDAHELRGALNGVAESNRCAGRFPRVLLARAAIRRLGRAPAAVPERQATQADRRMLRALMLRHGYQIVSLLPKRPGVRRYRSQLRRAIRERARPYLAEVAEFAASAGNWLQLQQARLWTQRYNLRWREVFTGTMDPLPPREGYRQLGYVVAQSMALRGERTMPDPGEVGELLGVLVEVEAWPEAWKLARFAERRLGEAPVVPGTLRRIDDGWRCCQYAGWMRWAHEKGIF